VCSSDLPVQKPIARVKTGKIEPKSGKTVQAAVAASRVQNPAARNGTEKAASTVKHQSDSRKLNDLFTKKPIERKPDDVLAISNTIPIKAKNDISPSKIASISYGITNPVRRNDSYSVRTDKEPPGKFELEFVVHASAEMLYEFLSTPSGLSEWFCD